ncbi:restriction endonuclease subunit S [Candidatus Nitrotoga arctica]|uniref:Restriction endonuclease subunit S n=1 Tax=Candidatus Nitrotoga arctica TaxID=453162 RepID=A0ABM8YWN2_9PROT|nr:restriction endonuclease subunit S [Candidatus Nitrotoga arctica]CAG9931896.1 Restriction endonuclease subunit S [Candidatus Nitrotoga arctica]
MSDVSNLPKNWVQVTIADLGKIVSGGTPSTKENSYWGGNISWISPSDLTRYSNKCISKGAKSITQEGLKKSSATIMPAGSVHFSSRAPIGYTVISSCDMTTNQGFKSLVPAQGILNEYIYYYFKSAKQLAESKATGTTFKEISGTSFSMLPVPLPPTKEQRRIVAKIEELFSELDKGIENLKTGRAQLKVYRQALLKHAFEGKLTAQWRAENQHKLEAADVLQKRIQRERAQRHQQQLANWEASGRQGSKPKVPKPLPPLTAEELAELPELPDGWGWTRLGNTNVDVSDGPFGSNLKSSDYVDSGVRVIRLENIGALKFIEEKESYITEEKYELLKRHTVTSGDIVFSSFIIENVRVALVPPSITKAINKADCFCVRFSGETLGNVFVVLFLSTRHVYKQLESLIHGVGRPRINTTQLKNVVIPVCSDAEQRVIIAEIEARLSEVDQLELTIITSLQQAEALRQSILKKAFSGQLVPQDPHEEPASVLLASIRAERAASKETAKPSRVKIRL